MTITNFTNNGKCSSCGACCSDILPISESEVQKIKVYIKKHNIKEKRHLTQAYDVTCPFRDDVKNICTIYEVRPEICREFKCDHTIENIKQAKLEIHKKHRIVFMRNEFFGNSETINLAKDLLKLALEGFVNGQYYSEG